MGPEGRLKWLAEGRTASLSVVAGAAVAELQGLAMADRFWREEGLLWPSTGSALGSKSVFAGVVLRRSALLSVGVFAGHAAFVLVSGSAWPSWHARGPGFESP